MQEAKREAEEHLLPSSGDESVWGALEEAREKARQTQATLQEKNTMLQQAEERARASDERALQVQMLLESEVS